MRSRVFSILDIYGYWWLSPRLIIYDYYPREIELEIYLRSIWDLFEICTKYLLWHTGLRPNHGLPILSASDSLKTRVQKYSSIQNGVQKWGVEFDPVLWIYESVSNKDCLPWFSRVHLKSYHAFSRTWSIEKHRINCILNFMFVRMYVCLSEAYKLFDWWTKSVKK